MRSNRDARGGFVLANRRAIRRESWIFVRNRRFALIWVRFSPPTPPIVSLESPEEWVNAKAPRGQGQIRQGGRGEDGGWRIEEDEANRARSHGFAILQPPSSILSF